MAPAGARVAAPQRHQRAEGRGSTTTAGGGRSPTSSMPGCGPRAALLTPAAALSSPATDRRPACPRCDRRSPGPVTAAPSSSMGRQVLSTKSSGAVLGFGSSKRLIEHATDVPGPGAWRSWADALCRTAAASAPRPGPLLPSSTLLPFPTRCKHAGAYYA
jgi:hypothetical protein